MAHGRLSRRNFLGGALSAAAFAVVPRQVLGAAAKPPPSDIITHAVVGTGGMGSGHVRMALGDKKARLLAVCDVDSQRLGRALKTAQARVPECKAYGDFRQVLDRGDIDCVHVPTPPHWHALISIAAAQAGCDVFCEKPMTRTIAEGQHVIDAVQANGRVFRLNTWFRLHSGFYGMGCPVAPIKKLVMHRLLGWPLTVVVAGWTGFNWKLNWSGKTSYKPEPVPPQLDYDMWLGPAPVKPYCRHRTHGSFRGYWDYDGGGLADMGQHYLDPVQYLLEKDDTSPITIEAVAPFPAHPDACGKWGRVELTYADGCKIILETNACGPPTTQGRPYIEGPKGKIYRGFKTDPPDLKDALAGLADPPRQISDFNESIVTRNPFGLNEVNGNRSNMLVHLANCAIRTGRKLTFDPVAMRFVGDDEANRLADQPMRAPWHL